MRKLHTIARVLWIVIPLIVFAEFVAAQQAPPERPWTFRFQLGAVGVSNDSVVRFGSRGLSVSSEDSGALGVALERRFGRLVGLELSVLHGDPTVAVNFQSPEDPETRLGTLADFGMTPVSLALNFHVIPRGKVDLYLGPVFSYIHYDDVNLNIPHAPHSAPVRNESTYGFQIGLDLRVGRGPWAFNAALRGLRASPEAPELAAPSLDIDPLFVMVGFGYGF